MIAQLLQIAAGGAIGSAARYLLGLGVARMAGPGMPLGVLTANVLGCLLMGLFVGASAERDVAWLNPFVATGLLGGFTTFSSFSMEAVELMQDGQGPTALLYIALSVGAGLGALYLGLTLSRLLP